MDNEPNNKPAELTDEFVTPLKTKLSLLRNQIQNFSEQDMDSTRALVSQVISIRATAIMLKIKLMCERWQTYLPFKEAIDVNFGDWAAEVEQWKETIHQPLLSLFQSKEEMRYWQDLYGATLEDDPFWKDTDPKQPLERNVEDYCIRVDQMLRNMDKTREQWIPKVERLVMRELGLQYVGLSDMTVCLQTLDRLKLTLEQAHQQFNSPLEESAFQRHSIRLRQHHSKDTLSRAKAETTKWDNAWPGKSSKEKARAKKDELKDKLNNRWWSSQLNEYVDLDFPRLYEDSDFGRFLYSNRHKLSVDDVQLIMKTSQQIGWCNEKQGIKRPKPTLRELTETEQGIVDELMAIIEKGNWNRGYTVTRMKAGMRQVLGLSQQLNEKEGQMSEEFWKLLKKRKNSDAEKSLKITFLNFVGWCQREGVDIISGGSPGVCETFFGIHNDEDYRAIDKGRGGKVAKFEPVVPLLLRSFKGVIEEG